LYSTLLFNSCSENSNPVAVNKEYDWEGETGLYNTAYEDSILFTSARCEGTYMAPCIYIMGKDGSGIRPLVSSYFSFAPCYSPRRLKILFIADTGYSDFKRALYMMDANGNNKELVSGEGEDVWGVACSPDGNNIAYIVLGSHQGRIRVKNMKDSTVKDITGWYGSSNFKTISWSPDSKQIVFDGMPGDRIGIANADGSGYNELFSSDMGCYNPKYSHDGKYVVYCSYSIIDSAYYSNIFTYNTRTGVSEQITTLKYFSYDPCWSPDDSEVIFASSKNDSPSYLFKVSLATKEVTQLTSGAGVDYSPFW
jgi:Tol biopolymer transport system component